MNSIHDYNYFNRPHSDRDTRSQAGSNSTRPIPNQDLEVFNENPQRDSTNMYETLTKSNRVMNSLENANRNSNLLMGIENVLASTDLEKARHQSLSNAKLESNRRESNLEQKNQLDERSELSKDSEIKFKQLPPDPAKNFEVKIFKVNNEPNSKLDHHKQSVKASSRLYQTAQLSSKSNTLTLSVEAKVVKASQQRRLVSNSRLEKKSSHRSGVNTIDGGRS